jgi:UDP-N-acetylglucosamine--N-acetylmuramyl-(pentapeptide) pyrophosphoryl-undecaprenol N-acetylglucosamine transferase
MINPKKILIATGGTGGHVFPAYALAKHFTKKDYIVKIALDKRGFIFLRNYKDFDLKIISSSPMFKKNPISILLSFFKNIYALLDSLFFLFKFKPNIVFGMGGYSSYPMCLASKILKIKFITYENNLYLGKTNKYLLSMASKMLVANKELGGVNKKYVKKVFSVGNIVRQEILAFNSSVESNQNILSILILGGSQAAKIFGEKLPKIFEKCIQEKIRIKIFQQCLVSQKEELKRFYENLGIEFEVFNFSHNLLNYFSKSNLVITRSGASMIAELLNCNIPFVSIPLPTAADNHQFLNAKYFEKKGYGICIEEAEISLKLFQLIKSIHKDKDLLNQIKKKQNEHSDKLVFEKIDEQLNELINE